MSRFARAAAGFIAIVAIAMLLAAFWLPATVVVRAGAVAVAVGLAAIAALWRGRRHGINGALAGLVAGFFLKLVGIVALYYLLRRTAQPLVGGMALLLVIYLLQFVWISRILAVSSHDSFS